MTPEEINMLLIIGARWCKAAPGKASDIAGTALVDYVKSLLAAERKPLEEACRKLLLHLDEVGAEGMAIDEFRAALKD